MIFRSVWCTCRNLRPTRSALARIGLALLVSLACCLQISCGESEEAKSQAKALERNRSKAEQAIEEAREAGVSKLFKKDFEKYADEFSAGVHPFYQPALVP